jgi:hypothetical protein
LREWPDGRPRAFLGLIIGNSRRRADVLHARTGRSQMALGAPVRASARGGRPRRRVRTASFVVVNLRATNGTGFGSGGGDGRTVPDIGVPHAAGLSVYVRLDVVAANACLLRRAPRCAMSTAESSPSAIRRYTCMSEQPKRAAAATTGSSSTACWRRRRPGSDCVVISQLPVKLCGRVTGHTMPQ